jgi:hypothetical protein
MPRPDGEHGAASRGPQRRGGGCSRAGERLAIRCRIFICCIKCSHLVQSAPTLANYLVRLLYVVCSATALIKLEKTALFVACVKCTPFPAGVRGEGRAARAEPPEDLPAHAAGAQLRGQGLAPFHHVALRSKHQLMTAGTVHVTVSMVHVTASTAHVTNLTPGSECNPRRAYGQKHIQLMTASMVHVTASMVHVTNPVTPGSGSVCAPVRREGGHVHGGALQVESS